MIKMINFELQYFNSARLYIMQYILYRYLIVNYSLNYLLNFLSSTYHSKKKLKIWLFQKIPQKG